MTPLWSSYEGRGRIPAVGASDLIQSCPVTPDKTVNRGVHMAATCNQELLGLCRDDTVAGVGCTIFDNGNEVRVLAATTVPTIGIPIGVVGVTSVTHPLSGSAVNQALLGPVAAASGSVVWQIGESRELGTTGDYFSVIINPRQLSGLA